MAQKQDIMAQAVWLAQLEAAKNNCQCRTCQILRKAATSMTDVFLAIEETGTATPPEDLKTPLSGGTSGGG